MKTLYYRRHSIKDGPNNTIGPEGLELAQSEGEHAGNIGEEYYWMFHGPLIRTAQTALAFLSGLALGSRTLTLIPIPMPIIEEIGTDELFAKIGTPECHAAVKSGMSNLMATLTTHPDVVGEFITTAMAGVKKMFSMIDDGPPSIAFGHSPMIELAAYGIDKSQYTLGELEGLVFIQDDNGDIAVARKISTSKG